VIDGNVMNMLVVLGFRVETRVIYECLFLGKL